MTPGNRMLAGRTVVISGGAQGIGAGVARTIVEQGGSVVLGDLDVDKARRVAGELGEAALACLLDVTSESSWSALVDEAAARFGAVHGLVAGAGILQAAALLDFELAMFRRVLAVNLNGVFLGIKAVAPRIAAAGGGSIVVVSSTEGLQGANAMAAYASSKWAVRGLAKVAARELGCQEIRVNSIHPGPIDTPMFNPSGLPRDQLAAGAMFDRMPLPRAAAVSEVGDLCAFLLSDRSTFITGAEIAIDGGLTSGNFVANPPTVAATAAG